MSCLQKSVKKTEAWENVASEDAAKIRELQDELSSEQAKTFHLKDKLELAEKNRDDAIYGRDGWERKSEHYKKKADNYAAQIAKFQDKLSQHKDSIASANRAIEYFQNRVDMKFTTVKAEVDKYKDLTKMQKEEIANLKAALQAQGGEAPGLVRPSRASKPPSFFSATAPFSSICSSSSTRSGCSLWLPCEHFTEAVVCSD